MHLGLAICTKKKSHDHSLPACVALTLHTFSLAQCSSLRLALVFLIAAISWRSLRKLRPRISLVGTRVPGSPLLQGGPEWWDLRVSLPDTFMPLASDDDSGRGHTAHGTFISSHITIPHRIVYVIYTYLDIRTIYRKERGRALGTCDSFHCA